VEDGAGENRRVGCCGHPGQNCSRTIDSCLRRWLSQSDASKGSSSRTQRGTFFAYFESTSIASKNQGPWLRSG
jgi:hypothetical protein